MTERYSANIVAENIYSQCDSEGNQYLVLKEIVDHKSDESAFRAELMQMFGSRPPFHFMMPSMGFGWGEHRNGHHRGKIIPTTGEYWASPGFRGLSGPQESL